MLTPCERYLRLFRNDTARKAFIACSAALFLSDDIACKIIKLGTNGISNTPFQLLLDIKRLGCVHEQWDDSWYIVEGVRLDLASHLDEIPAQTQDELRRLLATEADRRRETGNINTELGRYTARAASLEAAFQRSLLRDAQAGRDFLEIWKAARDNERQVIAATVETMALELGQRLGHLPIEVMFLRGMAAHAKGEHGLARACLKVVDESGREDLSALTPLDFGIPLRPSAPLPEGRAPSIYDLRPSLAEENRFVKKIRVLQLHNLNVGPSFEDSPFQALRSFLERQELTNKIDYLVVCGNFTRDRSHQSFQHAKKMLSDLASECLLLDGPLANRMVLVPGPLDVPDPDAEHLDFEEFRRFYQNFFKAEFGVEKKFDPQRAELRELKDITFVGLTYWKSEDPEVSRNRVRSFGEALKRAVRSTSSLAYGDTTPALLVSAGTPLLSNGKQWPAAANRNTQNVSTTDLRISFHLFGGGTLSYIPPISSSYEHVSLGLGSEGKSGDLWPLKVNLLELDSESSSGERLTADWTVFEQRVSGEAWEKQISLLSLEVKKAPVLEPQFEALYFDFLEQLSYAMFQPEAQMIHGQGFPGSGISEVFTWLTGKELRDIGGRQVYIHGHRWKGADDFVGFLRGLGTETSTSDGSTAHLIVLYDPGFQQITREGRRNHVEKILDACQVFFFQTPPFQLLYLTDFVDGGFKLDRCVQLTFGALDGPAADDFFYRYSCCVPLNRNQVAYLTGGYVGLSQRLFRGCEFTFASWSGAQDIDERTSAMLLGSSFGHSEVRATCQRFLDCVKSMGGGTEVFDYVRKQVLDHYDGPAFGESAFSRRIEVDFDECGLARFRSVSELLSRYQILDRIGMSNRYEVRVTAPFLGQRGATVYFSYHSEDKHYVEKIKVLLEEKGREERSEVKVLAYSAGDRRLEEDLAKSRNLCIFLPHVSTFGEGVDSEVKIWEKTWSEWPDSCRIALVSDRHSLPPESLRRFHVIPFRERKADDVVADIFRRLAFEEMRWGFELKGSGSRPFSDDKAGGK